MARQRIAVVGSGVSGLSAAWLLAQTPRGHAVRGRAAPGRAHPYGRCHPGRRQPRSTRDSSSSTRAPTATSPPSSRISAWTASRARCRLPSAWTSPRSNGRARACATVFGQKRNLLRREFWRMLADILRFNRESVAWLASMRRRSDHAARLPRRGELLAPPSPTGTCCRWRRRSGPARPARCSTIRSPLSCASATTTACCRSSTGPQWRTVTGGGREYVSRLAAGIDDDPPGHAGAARPAHAARHVVRTTARRRHFDQVVLACHSDQALALLGEEASAAERRVLGAIRYQPNRAVLHTDAALLPRDRGVVVGLELPRES